MFIDFIPMLRDNYCYLIYDDDGTAALIDPAEAQPALAAVNAKRLELVAILNTHHHFDHVGGNQDLLAVHPKLRVIGFGPDASRIPGLNEPVRNADTVRIGKLEGRILSVPCHTQGHIAYLFGDALFSGDTLFAAGCGRFFEGTAEDMVHALYDVILALPDETKIYCGHEYTEKNLLFAQTVEPDNPAIHQKLDDVVAKRRSGQPSLPTTLAEERTYNPFLRLESPVLQASLVSQGACAQDAGPVERMAALRRLKDSF
jgi:hydroxyacylglutathione hydrolase